MDEPEFFDSFTEELVKASKKGLIKEVESLINDELTSMRNDYQSYLEIFNVALDTACYYGHVSIVKFLWEYLKNSKEITPTSITECVQGAIHGASECDDVTFTGHYDCIVFLYENGHPDIEENLKSCIYYNLINIFKFLSKKFIEMHEKIETIK